MCKIYCKEMAHLFMEAGKSDLQGDLAGGDPGRARVRVWRLLGRSSQCYGEAQRQAAGFCFRQAFILFRPSESNWTSPPTLWRANGFTS